MTNSLTTTPVQQPPPPDRSRARPRPGWWWPTVQLIVALALTTGALVFLLWSPHKGPALPNPGDESSRQVDAVRSLGSGVIQITPDTPLSKKLEVAAVTAEQLSAPILTVTGSVVAELRPGSAPAEDRWQFSTPELLNAYTDWRKSNADVELAEKQLTEIRELTTDRIATQKKLVERLRKLVNAGTDAPKDLDAEEGKLREATIQGRKDVLEAETAVRVAARNRAGLERQLSQAGADPHMLGRAPEGAAVIVADVPEAKVGLVRDGQACRARFYAFPGNVFPGKVSSLAPTISKERRTLRVLFELSDRDARLKPGMFADVGLGTDSRDALLAPTDGVIHVGVADYLLIGTGPGTWKVAEVQVGEVHGPRVEILGGVKAGDKVLGKGAILLKPFIVQAVQGTKPPAPDTTTPVGKKSAP
jgi:cobalt-zinc-cadmium efflux system membrane fusion protein